MDNIPNSVNEFRKLLNNEYTDKAGTTDSLNLVNYLKTATREEVAEIEKLIIDYIGLIPTADDSNEVKAFSIFIQFLSSELVSISDEYKLVCKRMLEKWNTTSDRLKSRAEVFRLLGEEDGFFTPEEIMKERRYYSLLNNKWYWIDVAMNNFSERMLYAIKNMISNCESDIDEICYRLPYWAEKFGKKKLDEIIRSLGVGMNEYSTFLSRLGNSDAYPD